MEQGRRESLRGTFGEMRTFLAIWAGQLVSGLGSGLTGFAVPVVVYEKTGSPEQFGLLMFAWMVPSLLLSPFAGALVDRWDRRRVLVAADTGSAVITLVLAWLVLSGHFQVWQVFAASVAASVISAFQEPAFTASIAMLVPRRQYGRAMGLMQTVGSITQVSTPIISGVLVVTIGLGGIMLIDVASYLAAVGTLLLVRIPNPERTPGAAKPSLLADAAYGWSFLRARPGMFALLLFFMVTNFWMGFINPLLSPMVLAFTTPAMLGTIASVIGVGSLISGLALGVWGGPERRMRGIFLASLAAAVCTAGLGLRPSVVSITIAGFFFALCAPVMGATSSAIWLAKTPPEAMGRVMAVRRMTSMIMMPLAILASGPLAQRVFEPMLMPGGALAGSVGAVIGVGKGRGIALMFLCLGAVLVLTTVVGALVPRIRNVERDVPDAPHPAPAPPPAAAEPAELGELAPAGD